MSSIITIATWNVNSVKARLPNLLQWLQEKSPDIVLLQEIKTIEDTFPTEAIEDLGYNLAIKGQKTYNGVAILSRFPIDQDSIIRQLPGDDEDSQARYIEAVISLPGEAIRVTSVYVPNGNAVDSDKFAYKMAFFERLHQHCQTLLTYDEKLVVGGDYNVAPQDIDVYNPNHLRETVCFHPDEQAHFQSLLHLGLTDAWRACHPNAQQFSWWDYRGGSWQNNKGMRIDFLLLSAQAADCMTDCDIDDATRGQEKASDHAPVWCKLETSSTQ